MKQFFENLLNLITKLGGPAIYCGLFIFGTLMLLLPVFFPNLNLSQGIKRYELWFFLPTGIFLVFTVVGYTPIFKRKLKNRGYYNERISSINNQNELLLVCYALYKNQRNFCLMNVFLSSTTYDLLKKKNVFERCERVSDTNVLMISICHEIWPYLKRNKKELFRKLKDLNAKYTESFSKFEEGTEMEINK